MGLAWCSLEGSCSCLFPACGVRPYFRQAGAVARHQKIVDVHRGHPRSMQERDVKKSAGDYRRAKKPVTTAAPAARRNLSASVRPSLGDLKNDEGELTSYDNPCRCCADPVRPSYSAARPHYLQKLYDSQLLNLSGVNQRPSACLP